MRRNHLFILLVLAAAAVVLAACSESGASDAPGVSTTAEANVTTTTAGPEASPTTTATEVTDTETNGSTKPTETPAPVGVDPSCDWDSGRLTSDGGNDVPTAQGSDLSSVIIGSWQHTHIDDGSGFEPVKLTTDIRFVLSADKFLYCQDVEGATDKSENSAPLKLEGTELILPSPATGYAVTAWNDDTMVWLNHRDGSLYLLTRR